MGQWIYFTYSHKHLERKSIYKNILKKEIEFIEFDVYLTIEIK